MKVLNITNSADGTAGEIAQTAVNKMNNAGLEAILAVRSSNHAKGNIIEIKERGALHGLFSKRSREILRQSGMKPDVIILYDIDGWLTPEDISQLSRLSGARMMWFLTDHSPITGGCRWPGSCEGYKYGCSDCIAPDNISKTASKKLTEKLRNYPVDLEFLSGAVRPDVVRESSIGSTSIVKFTVIPIETNATSEVIHISRCTNGEDAYEVTKAIANGIPVAGYDIGINPDLIIPGETGEMAEAMTAEALEQAISRLIETQEVRHDKISRACRKHYAWLESEYGILKAILS